MSLFKAVLKWIRCILVHATQVQLTLLPLCHDYSPWTSCQKQAVQEDTTLGKEPWTERGTVAVPFKKPHYGLFSFIQTQKENNLKDVFLDLKSSYCLDLVSGLLYKNCQLFLYSSIGLFCAVYKGQSTVNCGLKHYLQGSKFCIQPPSLTGKCWNLHTDRAPINNESCYYDDFVGQRKVGCCDHDTFSSDVKIES